MRNPTGPAIDNGHQRISRVGRAQYISAGFLQLVPTLLSAGTDPIVVAVPESFPPHYSLDEAGKPQGFAIDVFDALAKRTVLRFDYQVHPDWSTTVAAVKTGTATVMPNLGFSDDRRQWGDFTRPVEAFPVVLIVRQGSTIHGINELAGRVAAAVKANIGAKLLKKRSELEAALFESANDPRNGS